MFSGKLAVVFLVMAWGAMGSNIVQNPGFEDPGGTFTNWTQSGWTFSGSTHTGSGAALNFNSSATLSQVLVTVPGLSYTLSLWLHNTGPDTFTGSLGGTTVLSLTDAAVNPATVVYQQFISQSFVATSTSTTLNLITSTNGVTRLDDICVDVSGGVCGGTAADVPEPATGAALLSGLTMLAAWRKARLGSHRQR